MSIKKEIRQLFASNKIESVLEKLLTYSESTAKMKDFHNDVLSLTQRFSSWKEKELQGRIDSDTELNKILHSVLAKINEIDETSDPAPTPGDASSNDVIQQLATHFNTNEEGSILLYHLANSKYTWRTAATLAKRTGWTAEKVNTTANKYPNLIRISKNKTQKVIYRIEEVHHADALKILKQ